MMSFRTVSSVLLFALEVSASITLSAPPPAYKHIAWTLFRTLISSCSNYTLSFEKKHNLCIVFLSGFIFKMMKYKDLIKEDRRWQSTVSSNNLLQGNYLPFYLLNVPLCSPASYSLCVPFSAGNELHSWVFFFFSWKQLPLIQMAKCGHNITKGIKPKLEVKRC